MGEMMVDVISPLMKLRVDVIILALYPNVFTDDPMLCVSNI